MLLQRRKTLVEGRDTMSSGHDPIDDAAARLGTRVGADLRAARERVGWTLPAVSAHLRIRLPFLEAIEEGRIGDLPGNAYAVGFVRTYAQMLGLDPDEIGRRFRTEADGVNRRTELQFPAPVPERGVPAGALILVGVVLAIGAYIGWYRFSGDERSAAGTVQTVPERLASLAAPAAPILPAEPTAGSAATPAPLAPVVGVPAGNGPVTAAIPVPTPVPVTVPMSPAMFGPPAPAIYGPPVPGSNASALALPAAATPGLPGAPSAAGAFTASTQPGADAGRIVLRAKGEAWMQVREKQGQVLLNRVLRAGETWPVPVKGQLLLTTGNATATELLVDGTLAPAFAGERSVLRDLPLDPDMIRDGKLTAQLAAKPAAPKPN